MNLNGKKYSLVGVSFAEFGIASTEGYGDSGAMYYS